MFLMINNNLYNLNQFKTITYDVDKCILYLDEELDSEIALDLISDPEIEKNIEQYISRKNISRKSFNQKYINTLANQISAYIRYNDNCINSTAILKQHIEFLVSRLDKQVASDSSS